MDDLEMLSETQLSAVLETVAFMARQNRDGALPKNER